MNLNEKIEHARQTLKLAAEMSKYYYDAPLIVCYSGGKDSDVLLDIAKKCLKPDELEVINSHTTVDAPETVYHIRDVFKVCEAQGIKTTIRLPRDKDGNLVSMWSLIVKNLTPPTRLNRYCCRVLKEASTPNRMQAFGVRESESKNREGRQEFGTWADKKSEAEFRTTAHTFAMFQLDKLGRDDTYECEMIKACKENNKTVVNPIYHFTDPDVWQYIKENKVSINPLYAEGFTRVGCIGCPFADKARYEQFARYPKYKENYIKTFDRMLEARRKKNLPLRKYQFANGLEVYRWWMGEDPKQIRFDDLIKEDEP